MKKILFAGAMALLMQGCLTPYQKKSDDQPGYEVKSEGASPASFAVHVEIPNTRADHTNWYIDRAIGEECKDRGFAYFDIGITGTNSAYGFCYKQQLRRALALQFFKDDLKTFPNRLVVEALNNKQNTQARAGDEVIEANGVKLTSVGQLKKIVFDAQSANFIDLKVKRGDQTVAIKEPLTDFPGVSGPEALQSMAKLFR